MTLEKVTKLTENIIAAEFRTKYLFFTGKGGVGKTSLASATALALASGGRRVLLVSTDPASNLDETLGVTLSNHPRSLTQLPSLFALNIDPDQAAEDYRKRVISPLIGKASHTEIEGLKEQLSGACTVEIGLVTKICG